MRNLLFLILLLASCSAPKIQENTDSVIPQRKNEFRVITPEANWDGHYFHKINEQASQFQLTDIRAKALPEGDLKIRIWRGWDLSYLQGFILERSAGEWTALSVTAHKQSQKKLQTPKSGWEIAWRKLENAGVLSLPDAEEIKCNDLIIDGTSYIVEYNTNNTYRTYKYTSPKTSKCKEAKQFLEIRNIIREEFGKVSHESNVLEIL